MKNLFYRTFGKIIKNIFIFLGPIYIKIGQILSYDYPILNQLYTLQNDCPPLGNKTIKEIQEKYKLLNITDKQIAAGSIAVVHLGKLNNKSIVIKIKRPGIENKIKNSLWYTKIFINIILFIPTFKVLNLKRKIITVLDLYQNQTNFKNEIENWKLYKNFCKNSSNIIIPHMYEEFSNDEIIVMDYVKGDSILDIQLTNKQKHEIYNCVFGQFLYGLIKGIVHGDLHCGNFAYSNNKIIIYDFGIIIKLSKHEQTGMMNIFNSLYEKDAKSLINNFIKYFIIEDTENDISSFILDDKMIREMHKKIFREKNIIFLLLSIKNYIECLNLQFNNKMTLVELSCMSINSTFMKLNINKDQHTLINNIVEDISQSIIDL